jgi:hypothetical protein
MADTGKIAKNLERFAQAVAAHDRENPTHNAYGIGLAHFDMERLGFEEGEEILPGITIHADSGVTGNFRVLCDGQHDEGLSEAEEQAVEAIATQAIPVFSPAPGTREDHAEKALDCGTRHPVTSPGPQDGPGDGVELRRASGGDVALH